MDKKPFVPATILLTLIGIFIFKVQTNTVFCQETEKTVISQEHGTIKIVLPADWETKRLSQDKIEKIKKSGTFLRDNPNGVFSILISPLGNNPFYNTKSYQEFYLKKLKDMQKKDIEKEGYKWISDELSELFGVPVLIITYEKTNQYREILFTKNSKLYIFRMSSEKQSFDSLWSDIEKSIKTVEFVK